MSSMYDTRSRGRPLGITILCLIGSITLVFSLLGTLSLLGAGGLFGVIALFGLVLAFGKALVIYGLWNMRRWGYTLAIAFYTLSIVLDVLGLNIIMLVVHGVILTYLKSTARHFR